MNTLTIDIGNSSTKVDSWDDTGIIARELSGPEVTVDKILQLIKRLSIAGIIISTVRRDSGDFIKELRDKTGCKVVDFNNKEIHEYYDLAVYKGKIGSDRIAAIEGANVLFPDLAKLVVDLGTAMTIDVADQTGVFKGGNISAGLFTRMKALASSTSRLPEVKKIDYKRPFGEDTITAIEAGARNGVYGEILYSVQQAKNEYNIKVIVLTGGDAPEIHLEDNLKIVYDQYLVGRGLNNHLRSHYLQDAGNPIAI